MTNSFAVFIDRLFRNLVSFVVVAHSLNAALAGAIGHDETIYSIDGIHVDVAIGKACVVRHKNAVAP